jgi:hypothetical protein
LVAGGLITLPVVASAGENRQMRVLGKEMRLML